MLTELRYAYVMYVIDMLKAYVLNIDVFLFKEFFTSECLQADLWFW